MDYLDSLNQAQKEAVVNYEGASMVIAGAGSGKTRVLTYRIAHLIRNNVDPFNILALTFTNKAAREMKARINAILGDHQSQNIAMGTFHSVFSRILRYNADKLGYPTNFTIYDTQDSRSLIKSVIKELGLDDKIYKPNLVQGRISSAKNNLIGPEDYAKNAEIVNEDKLNGKPHLYKVYAHYAARCFKAGAMDFDDLLFKMNQLLRDYPDVMHYYQHKFKYILVDEYQDTNYSQYVIIKKLAAVHQNICVVGDDAQSIYAFRGANIQNILNFKKDYPDYKLFKLEQNYRSTKNIVNAANSVIGNNKDQIKKEVWTDNSDGTKIKLVQTLTDNEEGKVIAQNIYQTLQNEGAKNEDFAILYRTNAQSRSFEEALRKLNLPYKIYGGLSFYQRKEIKDLLSYYRLAANPKDEEALKRVINFPKRGIGKTSMDHVTIAATTNETDLWSVINNPQQFGLKISSAAQRKLADFAAMITSFHVRLDQLPAYELAHEIASASGILREFYSDKTPEGVARYENIQELLTGIKEFTEKAIQDENENNKLADFLIDVALLTDADEEGKDDTNKVSLMTIHASKGLEFPYVYIVGLEENLFPSQLSLTSRTELEEERRLFYVALTRAEKQATLSFAKSRFRFGQLIHNEPSRFIDEIDEQFLEGSVSYAQSAQGRSLAGKTSFGKKQATPPQPKTYSGNFKKVSTTKSSKSIPKDLEGLRVGSNVAHAKFGKGKVVKLEGQLPDKKATVFFPRVGQKQLLLKFAKLDLLD